MVIRKDDIYAKTSNGLDIFTHYIGKEFKVGKAFSSPFREDKKPSFAIFRNTNGIYCFKDHTRDDVKGDAVEFVKLKFNLDFKEALQRINDDLVLNCQQGECFNVSSPVSSYEMVEKVFDGIDEEYWQQYGISFLILSKYKVVSVDYFSPNGRMKVHSELYQPIFAYKQLWGCKVYQPFSSKHRFCYLGKKPKDYVFGWKQLPDNGRIVFLTGGEKDVMTLAGLGYPAISLNSETSELNPKHVQELKNRFRYVIVLYDCDETGVEQSTKLVETHNLMRMNLKLSGTKDSKDISDFVKQGGTKKQFKELIDEVIDNKFKSTLKILKPHIFNDNVNIERPIPVLNIEGHTILSRGNISVISGKVKTGKSALNYSLLAGAIRMEGLPIDTLGVQVRLNKQEQAVLHFDTEQSKYDWHNKLKQTVSRAGLNAKPDFFESYHLLEFTIWDRIKYLEDMFEYNHRKHNGIYLAVVDGVADLVKSVNDEVECNKVVDLFHRLAVEYDCPIVLLAHLNPDGGKMRGHLGSQLERKAESVLVVEREGEISNINPLFCRNANFLKIPMQQFLLG